MGKGIRYNIEHKVAEKREERGWEWEERSRSHTMEKGDRIEAGQRISAGLGRPGRVDLGSITGVITTDKNTEYES